MAKKTKKKRAGKRAPAGSKAEPLIPIQDVAFHETHRRRYLNYAMSVITSRALPDVRDGLKPVQRRILYAMQHELHLSPTSKPLKSARIVGDVMGKFHPHGDSAIYETLVRMAQDFSLRYPLVEGHGNFGSLDGDPAAAMRYTEARLQSVSMQLLQELNRDTVDYRPNYDGKTREPIVLPSRIPSLLVNGTTGIAVGLATNIPPHNLTEVCSACEALIQKRSLKTSDLMKYIKGPDFPTGGQILNEKRELRKIYEEGSGAVRVRGEYKVEKGDKNPRIVVSSIPYMVQKDVLVKSIGELIAGRKVPQLVDVRDESTTDVRIVLELKDGTQGLAARADVVMAYLFKHTALQSNFNVNLTCLVPDDDSDDAETLSPARLDLKAMLEHFIQFRFEVVKRRFEYDLRILKERIHILEGFRKIFNELDEAIRIIRGSNGRKDAGEKLMKRFKLDEIQANAILDLRLYKLAKLEIKAILEELREKKKQAKEIEAILASDRRLWAVVRRELAEARKEFGDERRTKIGGRGAQETEYDEEAFIVDEDAIILLSRDGWVKRAGRVGDLSKVRMRQGDQLLSVLGGNTKYPVVFFSNLGSAYTIRINDIPASRGYGDPVQGLFKFRDGEKVIAAISLDPRSLKKYGSVDDKEGTIPRNHLLAISSSGYALRCSIAPFSEVSTRTGRKFMRLRDGEEVVGCHVIQGKEVAMVATVDGRVTIFNTTDVNFLSGPGRGVVGIKTAKSDRVLGTGVSGSPNTRLRVYTTGGRKIDVTTRAYKTTTRGGKGHEVIKRGGLERVELPELFLPDFIDCRNSNGGNSNGASNGKGKKK